MVNFFTSTMKKLGGSNDKVIECLETVAQYLAKVEGLLDCCRQDPSKLSKSLLAVLASSMILVGMKVREIFAVDDWKKRLERAE